MTIIKRCIAMMPIELQNELKRLYYRRQINNGTFITLEPEFHELKKIVNVNDWVIDIGANIGHYTNKLSELVGPKGRVIAFEPIPTTFKHLTENTLYSKHKNITLINAAVSDKTVIVGMSIPNFASGLKNYYQSTITSEANETDTFVLTFSIDSLQLSHNISLIKIDAEGHEPAVFRGLLGLLERDRPVLIVETVTNAIREQLFRLDYREERYNNSPNIVFLPNTLSEFPS
ncbi:FkbM family methyltransferase [Desulfocastanea catecholica]